MGKDWYGWAGSILYIDLTDGTIERKPLPRERVMQFVGGRGMNMRMLFDELKPGTDPLSPENPLILGTGPLTGTLVGSRMQASCKSPMTAGRERATAVDNGGRNSSSPVMTTS